ncbi:unnamed protein product, partial [Ectocarpus sp. 12 AP-2014]
TNVTVALVAEDARRDSLGGSSLLSANSRLVRERRQRHAKSAGVGWERDRVTPMMKWPCCAAAAAATGPSSVPDTAAGQRRPRHDCLRRGNTCRRRRQPRGARGSNPEGSDASAGAPAMGWWQEGRRHHGMAKVAVALGAALAAGCCAPAARAASAGASHSCTVLVGGTIKCWGENFWGQVGQNDNLVRGKN